MILEICMSSSDYYCTHFGICLTSIMENNKQHEINLHLLSNDISTKNLKRINELEEKYNNLHVYFYDINTYFAENDIVELFDENLKGKNDFYSLLGISTYARIFLPDMLSENIEKLLYLDSDMIVLDDLSELYNTNIDDYYFGACIESNIPKYIYYGKSENHPFINAGTLLINLKKWREDNFKESCIEFIKEYPEKNFLNDQNIINIIAHDNIRFLDSKFNVNTRNYYVDYKKILKLHEFFGSVDKFDDEKKMNHTLKNPVIMHFLSQIWGRPWIKKVNLFEHESKNPFYEKYYFYKAMSPWKDEPLEKSNNRLTSKIYYEMVRFMMIYFPSYLLILIHYAVIKIKN